MDLASGYSDSTNYGNGYTPLANNAINNNNFNYLSNQAAAQQAGMYNPFAQSGGFGAMTDYYSGAGAAYGRATGGFGGAPAAPAPNTATMFDGMSPGDMQTWMQTMYSAGRGSEIPQQYRGGGIGSDAVGAPNQPGVAVNWDKYFSDATGNQQPASGASATAGYDYNNPNTFAGQGGWGNAPANPNMQALLGYTPQTPYSGGGIGSDMARAPYQPGNTQNPYASQPWWHNFEQAAGPQGVQDWLKSQGVSTGQGGIGSDTSRDQLAWTLAQSSPYATAGAPANGPYPNLGYNPGMQNSFANPAMQQYDWTANNARLQQQMQDALKTIDGATGNQPAQPYGGQLPPFWQGVRDWTGMGDPGRPESWVNGS